VVDLVREGADGPLPDVHLLAPQLGSETLDEHQVVTLAVELEGAAGDVEDLLFAAGLQREKGVAPARQRLPQGLRALLQNLSEDPPLQASTAEEHLARRAVGEDHPVPG